MFAAHDEAKQLKRETDYLIFSRRSTEDAD